MTPNAIDDLKELLNEWQFGSLIPAFYGEHIDINGLKVMTPTHLKQLGKKWNIKIGILIKFETRLISWQQAVKSNYLSTACYNLETNKSNQDTKKLNVDVEQILNSSSQGRLILDYYKKNSKLNGGLRILIVELVTTYMIQNDIRMTVNLVESIAENIVQVFQTEFLGYYYLRQPGKKPQGKLYDKYFNLVRKLKKSGALQKRTHSNKSSPGDKQRVLNLNRPEIDIDDSIEAILNDNCSWAEVEKHWAASKNYRLNEVVKTKCISDILDKWVQYKKPLGFQLIDMDFKHLYPNADSFHNSFKSFATKIISEFHDRIKDQASKLLLQNMEKMNNITENGRCIGIFYLLHSILVPSTKTVNVINGKRLCTRYSIRDSQKSFIVDGSTFAGCEEELLKRQEAKTQIQPTILVVGSILEPQEIIVYFEGIKYTMHSAVHAIDTCFKIFLTFNLEYPKESILVWSFIQKYFYKIVTSSDYSSPQINSLISNLK